MLARIGRPSFAVLLLALVSVLVLPDRAWAQVAVFDSRACATPGFKDCTDVFTKVLEAREPVFVRKDDNRGRGPRQEHGNNGNHGNNGCKHGNCAAPDTPQTTVTPEPATIVLLGTGLAGLAGWSRRRKLTLP